MGLVFQKLHITDNIVGVPNNFSIYKNYSKYIS